MNQTTNDTDGTPKHEDQNASSAEGSPAQGAASSASGAPAAPEPASAGVAPLAELETPPAQEDAAAPAAPPAPAAEGTGAVASAPARQKGPLRRFFLMEERLADARQATFAAGHTGFADFELARGVLDAADAMSEFPERRDAALLLFRDALSIASRAFVARKAGTSEGLGDDVSTWHALSADPSADAVLVGVGEPERARIERLLAPSWAAELVALSKADRGAAHDALARAARQLVASLERDAGRMTKVKVIRALRWLLLLLAALVVVAGVMFALRSLAKPANVARGKAVTLSSYHRRESFPPERLVDGNTAEIGCHTRSDDKPWAQIDLGAEHAIRRVVVHNRMDRFKQRAVPLVIETSLDGKAFAEFARREDAFTKWDATGASTKARFVRLQVQKKTELHLNEVEVY